MPSLAPATASSGAASPTAIEVAPLTCSESLVCSDLLEDSDADGLSTATTSSGTLVAA